MAYYERWKENLGTLGGWYANSSERLDQLINLWRDETKTPKDLAKQTVEIWQEQFLVNWESGNALLWSSGDPLPHVTIKGVFDTLNGKADIVTVGPVFKGVSFQNTILESLGTADTIPAADYRVDVTGAYDGQVRVTMTANAPAAGTYRGLVLYKNTGMADFEPLIWVVVVAT